MGNNNSDDFAKNLLSNSKLSIENPDFNKIVMQKIGKENRKKLLLHNLKYFSLAFVGIDILIIALLKIFNISITNIPEKFGNLSFDFMSGKFFLFYFAFLIVSTLIIIKVSQLDIHIQKRINN